jgi:hypothetical protein
MTVYQLGDGVNLEHQVRDRDEALTAATVAITVTRPDGTSFTAPAISTPSTGIYRAATFVPDAVGAWAYAWSVSDTVTDVAPGGFYVQAAALRDHYCTVAELREHFGDTNNLLDADVLEGAIAATSRAIDEHCGRRFWQDPTAQVKVYRPDDWYEADVDDISTTSGLIVKTDPNFDGTWATTWDSDDYQLEPLNADTNGPAFAWWRIVSVGDYLFPTHPRRTTLQVTARFGWSTIPAPVKKACLIRAAAIFKRKEAVLGVAGFNGFGEVRIGSRDPDVIQLLHPFVKVRVGAV